MLIAREYRVVEAEQTFEVDVAFHSGGDRRSGPCAGRRSRRWRPSAAPAAAHRRHSTRRSPDTRPRSPEAIDRAGHGSGPDTMRRAAFGASRPGRAGSCRSRSEGRRRRGGAPVPKRTEPLPGRVGGRRRTMPLPPVEGARQDPGIGYHARGASA
jgi:hypothetical protein